MLAPASKALLVSILTQAEGAGFWSWAAAVYEAESSFAPPPQLPGVSCAPGMSAVTVCTGDSVTWPAASCVLHSLLTKFLLILSVVPITAIQTIRVISP